MAAARLPVSRHGRARRYRQPVIFDYRGAGRPKPAVARRRPRATRVAATRDRGGKRRLRLVRTDVGNGVGQHHGANARRRRIHADQPPRSRRPLAADRTTGATARRPCAAANRTKHRHSPGAGRAAGCRGRRPDPRRRRRHAHHRHHRQRAGRARLQLRPHRAHRPRRPRRDPGDPARQPVPKPHSHLASARPERRTSRRGTHPPLPQRRLERANAERRRRQCKAQHRSARPVPPARRPRRAGDRRDRHRQRRQRLSGSQRCDDRHAQGAGRKIRHDRGRVPDPDRAGRHNWGGGRSRDRRCCAMDRRHPRRQCPAGPPAACALPRTAADRRGPQPFGRTPFLAARARPRARHSRRQPAARQGRRRSSPGTVGAPRHGAPARRAGRPRGADRQRSPNRAGLRRRNGSADPPALAAWWWPSLAAGATAPPQPPAAAPRARQPPPPRRPDRSAGGSARAGLFPLRRLGRDRHQPVQRTGQHRARESAALLRHRRATRRRRDLPQRRTWRRPHRHDRGRTLAAWGNRGAERSPRRRHEGATGGRLDPARRSHHHLVGNGAAPQHGGRRQMVACRLQRSALDLA